jgi:hypothetical protein
MAAYTTSLDPVATGTFLPFLEGVALNASARISLKNSYLLLTSGSRGSRSVESRQGVKGSRYKGGAPQNGVWMSHGRY